MKHYNHEIMTPQNKRLKGIVISITLLLSLPLVFMQFKNEVNWTLSDFIVAAALLFGTGLIIEFVLRKVKKKEHRILLSLIIVALLILIWAELAVGIFGTPISGS